jgi:hypothetical protein
MKMKHVAHTPQIDLTTWTLTDWRANLEELIRKTATETLREVFENEPPRLSLAAEWSGDEDGFGGPAVTDAAMMYVELSLSPNEDNVVYGISLEDVVDGAIGLHSSLDGKVRSAEGWDVCRRIAGRLRELAAKLDDACASDAEAA